MNKLRAVIFDFGNVIALPVAPEKIARAAHLMGLPADRFWQAAWVPRLDYDAGLLEPLEYWNAVAAAAHTTLDPALLPALVRHEIGWWNQFDQRVLAWCDALRASGIRTAILSNLPRVLGEALRAAPGFLEHFDHVTFSYELRMIKPSPAIYRHAVEGLRAAPGETLFIDDKPANVEGASVAGLHAELFTTWEEFLTQGIAARYGLPGPGRAELLQSR
jgi:putative hydrolase of the HAD superfamily